MSARVVYIGEKLLASGLALSGVEVFTPPPQADAVWEDLDQARTYADLILLSAEYAELLGQRLRHFEQRNPVPPVLRLPAAEQRSAPVRETIQAARASLGLS